MKRILLVLLALVLMLGLCGCGDFVSILPGTEIGTAEAPGEDPGKRF